METYIELIEFIKAHKIVGTKLDVILEAVAVEFIERTDMSFISVGGVGNIIDITYREPEHQLVTVTSIFIK